MFVKMVYMYLVVKCRVSLGVTTILVIFSVGRNRCIMVPSRFPGQR